MQDRTGVEQAKCVGLTRAGGHPSGGGPRVAALGPAGRQLLRLQRHAGNRAVGDLIASAHAPALQVQRKIGFEIETRIPIAEKATGKIGKPQKGRHRPIGITGWRDIRHKDFSADISAVAADLTVDHSETKGDPSKTPPETFEQLPIIEFVTRPVDENITPEKFRSDHAEKWLDYLRKDLFDNVKTDEAQDVKTVIPTAVTANEVVVGLPGRGKNATLTIQSTIGLPLSKIHGLLASHSLKAKQRGTMPPREDPTKPGAIKLDAGDTSLRYASSTEGLSNVDTLLSALVNIDKAERKKAKKKGNPLPPLDLQPIRGLLLLMSQTLVAQKYAHQRYYLKNRPALFAKSELSAVRNSMMTGGYAATLLTTNTNATFDIAYGGQEWLLAKILETNDWKPTEVFHSSKKKGDLHAGTWAKEVLSGSRDQFFERAKNKWSKAINPESIGGEVAPVVELRHVHEILSGARAGLDLTNTQAAVDQLVALFNVYKLTLS